MAEKKNRASELDFLRGFALFMMLLMHLAYDLRYEFGLPVFAFLEANWFWAFLHPFFLVIFVGISGVCSTFSRNNLIRGLKLLGVAAGLTLVTYIVTKYMGINCLIIFNVIALLAVSILFYSAVQFIEKKAQFYDVVYTTEKDLTRLEALPRWDNETLLGCLTGAAAEWEVKNALVMWPLRIAAAGRAVTPGGATEICEILGREETLRRVDIALEKLAK